MQRKVLKKSSMVVQQVGMKVESGTKTSAANLLTTSYFPSLGGGERREEGGREGGRDETEKVNQLFFRNFYQQTSNTNHISLEPKTQHATLRNHRPFSCSHNQVKHPTDSGYTNNPGQCLLLDPDNLLPH